MVYNKNFNHVISALEKSNQKLLGNVFSQDLAPFMYER